MTPPVLNVSTTALHLHHVTITSNHVTATIHSKFCAHLRSLFGAQLFMLLTKQLSRSTDQGRPWVCPKVAFAWYSLRLEFLLILRKGMSGRPVRPVRPPVIRRHERPDRQVSGETALLLTNSMATYESCDVCSWDYIWAKGKKFHRLSSRLP